MELIRQQDELDCGIANCVMIINHFHNKTITIEEFKLKHSYKREEYSLKDIKQKLSNYKIDTGFYEINNVIELLETSFPVLLVIKNEEGFNHYVSIENFENGYFKIMDPNKLTPRFLSIEELNEISLNYVGIFTKLGEIKKEKLFNKKQYTKFIKFVWYKSWKTVLLINLLNCICTILFLLANMFIKVMLVEYSFLDLKRILMIFCIFLVILFLWTTFNFLKNKIIKENDYKINVSYIKETVNKRNVTKSFTSFNANQLLDQIYLFISFLKSMNIIFNNLFSTILFTICVFILVWHISIVLLLGTILLIICLSILKYIDVKRKRKNIFKNKNHSIIFNNFLTKLVMNIESIEHRITIIKQLDLNKNILLNKNNDYSYIGIVLEKVVIYLYYVFMIFFLFKADFEISTFIVITNIVLSFSMQLEKLIFNFTSSIYLNSQLNIFNLLKKDEHILKISRNPVICINKKIVNKNIVWIKDTKKVLIDYIKLDTLIQNNECFDTTIPLLEDELISNNLFNFGNNEGIENYTKVNLDKFLDRLKIDISQKTKVLNFEQKEFIKICSALFTEKQIILIKKNQFWWFNELVKTINKTLVEKVIVYYEN